MEKTQNVNQLMDEISAASQEQAKGTSQISEALGQMEKVVQSNAATAEESAASAEELQHQAKALRSVVIELNQLVKGHGDANQLSQGTSKREEVLKLSTHTHSDVKGKQIVAPDDVIPLDDEDDF